MHTLVIGGTGMLRRLCLTLASRDHTLSVVARRDAPLAALAAEAPGAIHPIPADYTNFLDLAARLRAAVIAHGPIRLAIIWVHHDDAPSAPLAIAEFLADPADPCRLFHILGSSSMLRPEDAALRLIPGLLYHRILLGSVADGDTRRWLTDEEICDGVVRAIETDAPETDVGDRPP
jgi:NAD(P)-dependent dehydrogenase (short-subunit alcohol dehydrogenase family)